MREEEKKERKRERRERGDAERGKKVVVCWLREMRML